MENKNINVEIISSYLKEQNLSKQAFCKKAKISKLSFDRVMNNDLNISLLVMFRIARTIGVSIHELFKIEDN